MSWRPVPQRAQCQERLLAIFPREAFDTVLSNPLAAAAVAALIYVDAVVDDEAVVDGTARLANPSTCLWLSDQALAYDDPAERDAWYQASLRGRQAVRELEHDWGLDHEPWYGDNSRETLRDETFNQWLGHGAVRVRRDLPANSSRPRWALATSFADLFHPDLDPTTFDQAVERWTSAHLTTSARVRLQTLFQRERLSAGVPITLPGTGLTRVLEPGASSRILKGVLEQWAPQRLGDPDLLALSEPGDKVYLADENRLAALGITIDARNLLPDALIVDIEPEPPTFWIVEAVASDGVIDEERRRQLLGWARDQHLDPNSCAFLTAFLGRNQPAARRRLKDLAVGTFAWYADEPPYELAWYELPGQTAST